MARLRISVLPDTFPTGSCLPAFRPPVSVLPAVPGAASILAYLRAHLRKAEPCKLLKMLLVGPPRQGKTALLEALNAGRTSAFSTTDCSISTSTWELDKPGGCRNPVSGRGDPDI